MSETTARDFRKEPCMDTYFSEEENSREHFGIGLSICRMLCENHGGRLTLQNSVKQGAISAASLTVGTEKGEEKI